MQQVSERTIHIFGGGALDLSQTVLDTAEVVTGKDDSVSAWAVLQYIRSQGVDVSLPQINGVLYHAVRLGILRPVVQGVFQWVEEE